MGILLMFLWWFLRAQAVYDIRAGLVIGKEGTGDDDVPLKGSHAYLYRYEVVAPAMDMAQEMAEREYGKMLLEVLTLHVNFL